VTATSTGQCGSGNPLCGQPARLYPAGWRCDEHRPGVVPTPPKLDLRRPAVTVKAPAPAHTALRATGRCETCGEAMRHVTGQPQNTHPGCDVPTGPRSSPTVPDRADMLAAALDYVARGWSVFPCHDTATDTGRCSCQNPDCGRNTGKHPRTLRGYLDATTDPVTVTAWWTRWPHANIGIPCGPDSIEVLDFDVKDGAGGEQARQRLASAGLLRGAHSIVTTPSGGWHLYYPPSGQRKGSVPGHGIDMQGAGSYVLAPPSSINGKAYVIVSRRNLDDPMVRPVDFTAVRNHLAPRRPAPAAASAVRPSAGGDDRPGDDFGARVEWDDDLLLGGAGWRFHKQVGDQVRWTRPGKTSGPSALTGGDTDRLTMLTSSAAPFEKDVSYSKFAAYAVLHHGGDHRAAAKELRRLGYGRQGRVAV
jgi:hypothetical protein